MVVVDSVDSVLSSLLVLEAVTSLSFGDSIQIVVTLHVLAAVSCGWPMYVLLLWPQHYVGLQ